MNSDSKLTVVQVVISIALIIIVSFVVATNPENDALLWALVPILVVATIATMGYLATRNFKARYTLLEELRQKYPVAYFVAGELSGNPEAITSDGKELRLWQLNTASPKMYAVAPLKNLDIKKARTHVAILRVRDGISIAHKDDPRSMFKLSLLRDNTNVFMPLLAGDDLDEAIHRLKEGV